MSDMMAPRAPAKPPMGGGMRPQPPASQNPMEQNRSMMNVDDAGMMRQASGGKMTIRGLIEDVLKIPGGVEADVQMLVQALQRTNGNKDMMGKAQNMGGPPKPPGMGAPAGPPRPPMGGAPGGAPPMGGAPRPPMGGGGAPGMGALAGRL